MASIHDIIQLCKQDGGRVFIIDESGDVRLIIMDVAAYYQLHNRKAGTPELDAEKVNHAITHAQLEEPESPWKPEVNPDISSDNVKLRTHTPTTPTTKTATVEKLDLRAEVIDPNFNFEGNPSGLEEI